MKGSTGKYDVRFEDSKIPHSFGDENNDKFLIGREKKVSKVSVTVCLSVYTSKR